MSIKTAPCEQNLKRKLTHTEALISDLENEYHAWLINNPTQCRVPDDMDRDLEIAQEALALHRKELDDLQLATSVQSSLLPNP